MCHDGTRDWTVARKNERKGQVKILDCHDRISVNWVVLFNLDFVPFNLTHVDDTYETPLLYQGIATAGNESQPKKTWHILAMAYFAPDKWSPHNWAAGAHCQHGVYIPNLP